MLSMRMKIYSLDLTVLFLLLLFSHSDLRLNGGYDQIENNVPHNALEDLTGGVGFCETLIPVKLEKPGFSSKLWNDLNMYFRRRDAIMVWGTSSAVQLF